MSLEKITIEIDKPFDILSIIVNNRKEYGNVVFAEYIHSLLYHKTRESIEIIEWIKKNLSEHINLIIQEIIQYIIEEESKERNSKEGKGDTEYSSVMFDMCCQIDLEKTKHYWTQGIFVYDRILELYKVKNELENYKSKYESLKSYMENMSNGLLYYEMNDDYKRYMNQIR